MKQSTQVSFPVLSVLGIVFVALKLMHVITWSWWWVLAPFWVPTLIAIVVVGAWVAVAVFFPRKKRW